MPAYSSPDGTRRNGSRHSTTDNDFIRDIVRIVIGKEDWSCKIHDSHSIDEWAVELSECCTDKAIQQQGLEACQKLATY